MIPKAEDISFIIQGAINKKTILNSINNIHTFFPGSTIIISTWKGEDIKNIPCEKFIFNDDPGFYFYSKKTNEKINNVNRQIVSTIAGLREAQTIYSFKLRSDFIINGDNFINFFNKFTEYDALYHIFKNKVLACCYFTRDPQRSFYLFHPSDISFFGYTNDLINYFDIPLMGELDAYFDSNNNFFNRYVPEQYIFVNFLRKNKMNIYFHYYNDISTLNILETKKYFLSNFIFLNFEQFCLTPSKISFDIKKKCH